MHTSCTPSRASGHLHPPKLALASAFLISCWKRHALVHASQTFSYCFVVLILHNKYSKIISKLSCLHNWHPSRLWPYGTSSTTADHVHTTSPFTPAIVITARFLCFSPSLQQGFLHGLFSRNEWSMLVLCSKPSIIHSDTTSSQKPCAWWPGLSTPLWSLVLTSFLCFHGTKCTTSLLFFLSGIKFLIISLSFHSAEDTALIQMVAYFAISPFFLASFPFNLLSEDFSNLWYSNCFHPWAYSYFPSWLCFYS